LSKSLIFNVSDDIKGKCQRKEREEEGEEEEGDLLLTDPKMYKMISTKNE